MTWTGGSERGGVISTSEEWLSQEESRCFEDRQSRLVWLIAASPAAEYWTFPGGLHAKSLFEEARYCFVYAQFLAATLLSLAFIELTLAAQFYGAGRDDLERASLQKLLAEARSNGVIEEGEFRELERIRSYRNAYAHFRRPMHQDRFETRSVLEDAMPYEVIEQDATAAIAAALRLVATNAL